MNFSIFVLFPPTIICWKTTISPHALHKYTWTHQGKAEHATTRSPAFHYLMWYDPEAQAIQLLQDPQQPPKVWLLPLCPGLETAQVELQPQLFNLGQGSGGHPAVELGELAAFYVYLGEEEWRAGGSVCAPWGSGWWSPGARSCRNRGLGQLYKVDCHVFRMFGRVSMCSSVPKPSL